MKLRKMLMTISVGAVLAAPSVARAQFVNPAGGFFAARPFVFVGPGGSQFFSPPMGGFFGNGFVGNPYARMIGVGPIPTGFNSPIFPNGGVGLGFSNAFFPGAGTALNPAFDPRFGMQGAALNGFIPANAFSRFNNNAMLNPFFDPSGGFFNPALQNGADNPNLAAQPVNPFTGGAVVSQNMNGSTVLNAGIQPGLAANAAQPAFVAPDARNLVAERVTNGRVVLAYTGDTSIVRSVSFSLLDRNRKPIAVQISNTNPPVARLRMTSRTVYYRVNVEYANGQNQIVEGRI